MREKPYASLGIYVMAEKAILPTTVDTPAMWSYQTEPVEVFDFRNRSAFIEACKRAISRGIPQVPVPSEKEMFWDEQGPAMKEPVSLKYANSANWQDLERTSIYVKVTCYPSGFVLRSLGRAKSGEWSEEKVFDKVLHADAGIEGVVDAILEHLTTRKDLPGMTFDLPQVRPANGA